jgi:hypothetical protein
MLVEEDLVLVRGPPSRLPLWSALGHPTLKEVVIGSQLLQPQLQLLSPATLLSPTGVVVKEDVDLPADIMMGVAGDVMEAKEVVAETAMEAEDIAEVVDIMKSMVDELPLPTTRIGIAITNPLPSLP